MTEPRAALVALGNRLRRDDGIGPWLLDRLKRRLGDRPDLDYIELPGDGTALLEPLAEHRALWLFDAVRPVGRAAQPGRVHRLDAARERLPADFFHYSSHAFGLAEMIELARTLGCLPEQVVIYGIEGADFGHGENPSPAVVAGAETVIERVVQELEATADDHA